VVSGPAADAAQEPERAGQAEDDLTLAAVPGAVGIAIARHDPERISRAAYEVPRLNHNGLVALHNPLEKTELDNLPVKIDVASVPGILAVWAADVAAQVLDRAQPSFEEALAGTVGATIYAGLEYALLDNLVAGVTTSAPVLDAVAHALTAWGAPAVVLACETGWAACASALGPVGMISNLVPVAGDQSLATSVGNLGLLASDFQRFTSADPMRIGWTTAVAVEAVAWLADPTAAAMVTTT
jgi:hypothetical protein